jgi:hypothetical protein
VPSPFVAATAGFCWNTMVKYTITKKLESGSEGVTNSLQ